MQLMQIFMILESLYKWLCKVLNISPAAAFYQRLLLFFPEIYFTLKFIHYLKYMYRKSKKNFNLHILDILVPHVNFFSLKGGLFFKPAKHLCNRVLSSVVTQLCKALFFLISATTQQP